MPHPPDELPREPYRALAVFLLLPLATAAVGARRWAPATTAAAVAGSAVPYAAPYAGAVLAAPSAPRSAPGVPTHTRRPTAR